MATLQTIVGISKLSIRRATTIAGTARIFQLGFINGKTPLSYRIGTTDRPLGDPAIGYPEGFLVLNTTSGDTFEVSGGVWTSGTMDADQLAAWYATTQAYEAIGYRIGTTDRPLGEPTDAPEGFLVLNTTSGDTFEASGGVWVTGGAFPSDLLDAWEQA